MIKQIRWKLLIRFLFSEFRLLNKEVKLRLFRKRFEVLGQHVSSGHIQSSINYSRKDLQGIDIAFEEIIAFKDINYFSTIFSDK